MTNLLIRTAVALAATAPLLALGAGASERMMAPDAFDKSPQVAVVVFDGLPGASAILAGNYERGLEQSLAAVAERPGRNAMAMAANICAASIKLGRLEAANASCESALASRPPVGALLTTRQHLAVAHVNHGVVHYVQGDHEFAVQEFKQARMLFPSLGVASSNLALARDELRKPRVIVGETL